MCHAVEMRMTALRTEHRQLAELVATKEAHRLQARKDAALKLHGTVPLWVEAGMRATKERPEKVRHLIQMLLGTFAAHGVLALGDSQSIVSATS